LKIGLNCKIKNELFCDSESNDDASIATLFFYIAFTVIQQPSQNDAFTFGIRPELRRRLAVIGYPSGVLRPFMLAFAMWAEHPADKRRESAKRRFVGFNTGTDCLSGNRTFGADHAHVFLLPTLEE
jgi:hypothetical protein